MNDLYRKIQEETDDLAQLLIKKNTDYGDSFEKGLDEYGDLHLVWRLEDKLNRLKSLIKNKDHRVNESREDTIRDIAGYAVLRLAVRK